LDYAHEHGVIHRDVKPSNVLLDRGNWTLLTDFGVARMVEATQQLTGTGVGVGTPAYMSPEQGQGKKVDRRSDVYSLGVVLYEMLTGRVPFEAETPLAVVWKHAHEPLPLPRSLNPEIPEAVERVVLRALAKAPEDRFPTTGDLAKAHLNEIQQERMSADQARGEGSFEADGILTAQGRDQGRLRWLPRRFPLVALGVLSVLIGVVVAQRAIVLGARDKIDRSASVAASTPAIPGQPGLQTRSPAASPSALERPSSEQVLLADGFDDPTYDGSFNTSLWSCGGCAYASVTQSDGSIGIELENGEVALNSHSIWLPADMSYVQARIRLSIAEEGGVNLILRANLASYEWESSCFIQSTSRLRAEFGCDVYTYVSGQFKGEYVTKALPVSHNDWHMARIELTPNPLELRFYLDGRSIGQHVPVDAGELAKNWLRLSFGAYTNTHLVAHVDDVMAHQAP
jgi:hypothetical protein